VRPTASGAPDPVASFAFRADAAPFDFFFALMAIPPLTRDNQYAIALGCNAKNSPATGAGIRPPLTGKSSFARVYKRAE
jgi:hypothetical protein